MRVSRLVAALCVFGAPALVQAQDQRRDSVATVERTIPAPLFRVLRDSLLFAPPAPMSPFGRLAPLRQNAAAVADATAASLQAAARANLQALWGQTAARGWSTAPVVATTEPPGGSAAPDAAVRGGRGARRSGATGTEGAAADTASGASRAADVINDYTDLGLQLQSRLEAKGERSKNERCQAYDYLSPISNCFGTFQPQFDFQFNVRTGGVVADRIHVNVDYDSQREFDASNNISVYYQGKTDELIDRLEIGNVTFTPPRSRFITAGIPSGNYGLQATGQLGPMRFRTIVAQQKGNVVKDRIFTVGDRTLQNVEQDIEDYRFEPRRFFFTVDPRQFAGYPNIDILDRAQMTRIAGSLPRQMRPAQVFLYRLRNNEPPADAGGPEFIARGSKNGLTRRKGYQLLVENVDYYIDPSLLWFSLVRPLSLGNERLVVAYTVPNAAGTGVERSEATGGDPDNTRTETPQYANLIFDWDVTPNDSAFFHEIRSIYRLGGEDVQRASVSARIVTGNGDQEKPAGGAATYLQMLGLAQSTNSSTFDVDNRLWPRLGEGVVQSGAAAGTAGGGTRLIRDNFIVFPSLRPFALAPGGLVMAGNTGNDTLYHVPSEDLNSARRPQAFYRIRTRYQAQGGADAGALALGSVQVSRNSERLAVSGVPLRRDVDYTVDYELGRVTFLHPDTLFATPKQVSVQYEENPLFAAAPTSIFGLSSSIPFANGELDFTAISQSQKTTFTRPPLGLEPASSLVAGVSGQFNFDASPISRFLEKFPIGQVGASSIAINGEFATSRPQPNSAGQAYIESFEGEGGVTVPLNESNWYYSSRPAAGTTTDPNLVRVFTDTSRASTLVWQSAPRNPVNDSILAFSISDIDPQVALSGSGLRPPPEQLLWLDLYPLNSGMYHGDSKFHWIVDTTKQFAPDVRHWRSLRTPLGQTGIDLSRVETLEFWALIDPAKSPVKENPTLVFDFGDVSENSLTFSPTTLVLRNGAAGGVDSLFTGRKVQGFNQLDTERDSLTRTFNVQHDVGLPGDVIDTLHVLDQVHNATSIIPNYASCTGGLFGATGGYLLGDSRANCTIHNNRLDEEDLDGDFALNMTEGQQNSAEQLLRYTIDLNDTQRYTRTGLCYPSSSGSKLCWVLFRVPFSTPTDSINDPIRRRIRTLRMTMISGERSPTDSFTQVAIAQLKLTGSPWLKRQQVPIAGVGGDGPSTSGGYVVAGMIGTQDRSTETPYTSPPGVTDEANTKSTGYETQQVIVNERSLRLQAGVPGQQLHRYDRAEAYYRFAEGQKNFMGYKKLRVWARGRGNGWESKELQFYIKIGRDADNFYMYRTSAHAGEGNLAWEPEVQVDFEQFYRLRAEVQNLYLQTDTTSLTSSGTGVHTTSCTGADREMIDASRVSNGRTLSNVYAACNGGYMIYSIDPNLTPPNLAAVQELAVGMLRVDTNVVSVSRLLPGDTAEVWVDDIRLTDVVNTPGYAGEVGIALNAGNLGTFRMNARRQDPNFRQLAEQPSYVTDNSFDMGSTFSLERFLPQGFGFAIPLSVNYSSSGSDPYFISRSDVRGAGVEGLRTPASANTSYSLSLRRTAPLANPLLNAIVGNLNLATTYSTANNRNEFQEGTASNMVMQADYSITSRAREAKLPSLLNRLLGTLPDWLQQSDAVRGLRSGTLRWNPTQFRLTSSMSKSTDQRTSFLKPSSTAADDPGRPVNGLYHVWRNGSALELRPFSGLSARWDITSLRDLRDYNRLDNPLDTTRTTQRIAAIATAERQRLFGMDIGLERERQMTAGINLVPTISQWIRPRLDLGASYSMVRDPNTRTLLQEHDSVGAYRLPRRFNNSQTVTAGTTVDFARFLQMHFTQDLMRRASGAFLPVDVNWTQSLTSQFDGVAFTPNLGYQFALGGPSRFTQLGGVDAGAAQLSRSLNVNSGINLPLGFALSNRFLHSTGSTWSRRLANEQSMEQQQQTSFPDASLRWNASPPFLRRIVQSIGANVGYRRGQNDRTTPIEAVTGGVQRIHDQSLDLPSSASIAWAFAGGFTTTAGYNLRQSATASAAGTSRSQSGNTVFDVGRSFKLPASWNIRDGVSTRLGVQNTRSNAYVGALGTDGLLLERPRDASGRHEVHFNADTRVSETLSSSLVFSRVVNYNDVTNTRFSQMVLTAVLQLNFFAGDLK